MEHKQPKGHQDDGHGEYFPKQTEGKLGHGVGDRYRSSQDHRNAKVVPITKALGLNWVTVRIELTRPFQL